jgi:hypothetical protein
VNGGGSVVEPSWAGARKAKGSSGEGVWIGGIVKEGDAVKGGGVLREPAEDNDRADCTDELKINGGKVLDGSAVTKPCAVPGRRQLSGVEGGREDIVEGGLKERRLNGSGKELTLVVRGGKDDDGPATWGSEGRRKCPSDAALRAPGTPGPSSRGGSTGYGSGGPSSMYVGEE